MFLLVSGSHICAPQRDANMVSRYINYLSKTFLQISPAQNIAHTRIFVRLFEYSSSFTSLIIDLINFLEWFWRWCDSENWQWCNNNYCIIASFHCHTVTIIVICLLTFLMHFLTSNSRNTWVSCLVGKFFMMALVIDIWALLQASFQICNPLQRYKQ